MQTSQWPTCWTSGSRKMPRELEGPAMCSGAIRCGFIGFHACVPASLKRCRAPMCSSVVWMHLTGPQSPGAMNTSPMDPMSQARPSGVIPIVVRAALHAPIPARFFKSSVGGFSTFSGARIPLTLAVSCKADAAAHMRFKSMHLRLLFG